MKPKHLMADLGEPTVENERCIALRLKLEKARQRMKKLGIRSLLDGHKGWRKVVVMAEPPKAAKVVPIRRKS